MDTDYLVVGAGASGLAFADTLLAEADVDVTLVDRREAPGGHWRQAYPFVRLHTPSAFYGVNSLALGLDRIDQEGENAGFYERATGEDVREYFATVAERLTRTGRFHLLLRHEHLGGGPDGERVRDLSTGEVLDIDVRRKVVDARYLEASVPATHVRSFEVAPSARVVPVNDLPEVAGPQVRYAVLGSGKTAVDACVWLLDNGVEPDRIRWIRPRDAWFHDRRQFQPLGLVAGIIEGFALDSEAGALASSLGDLFERLESTGRLVRIDPSWPATMYRGTMLSTGELHTVRQIKDVLRLGHVRRIEADRILLDRGEAATRPEVVHVDCAALGLNNAPGTPVFQPARIVLQQVRHLSPCFNAALIAFVEAHRDGDEDKNRLCPPNPYPTSIEDWPGMMTRTWRAEGRWLREPDLSMWVARSRLNLLRDLPDHADEPAARAAVERFVTNVQAATVRLGGLSASA
ncbi:MAG TPA: NAD(P)-binding protein [Candidatus Acidoferrum sp.]|nr:NAD(P)-binding protein [Candidatus Acidoferrum sp.]